MTYWWNSMTLHDHSHFPLLSRRKFHDFPGCVGTLPVPETIGHINPPTIGHINPPLSSTFKIVILDFMWLLVGCWNSLTSHCVTTSWLARARISQVFPLDFISDGG